MTATADRVYDALVCGNDVPDGAGGSGAWVDLPADTGPLTAGSGVSPTVIDALVYPNETAAGLAQLVPSAELLPVLDLLSPAMLEVDGQIDALVAVERHIAMLQARSAELLAALEAGDSSQDGFTRDHVAAALRLPPASMRATMFTARELTERLPAAIALLRAGEITQRHALDLAEATSSLTPESLATVEASVLGRAPEQTVTQFRASVKRAVLRVASPAEEEQAHADAREERRVIVTPVECGMAELWALLPADDAAAVKAALDARAYETIHGKGGDGRTADQRRADALVEMACTALADPHLAKAHGQRPGVQVTVAASTLMGLDDQPAELDGYGPITAAMARRIAFDPTATWRRFLTDDHGHIQSAGTRTYRPAADLTRTVIARDVHCVFPGCRTTARHTDIDHIKAYRKGDRTTRANLMSLCRRHHRLKHTGRWTVHRDNTTGITTWTHRRNGRSYQSRPPTQPTTTDETVQTEPVGPESATTTASTPPPNQLPPRVSAAPTTSNDDEPPPF